LHTLVYVIDKLISKGGLKTVLVANWARNTHTHTQ